MKKILITSLLVIGMFVLMPKQAHACYYPCDSYYGYGYQDNYSGGYDDSWYNFGGYEPDNGMRTLPYYLLGGVNAWLQDRWYGNNYYDPYSNSGYGNYDGYGYDAYSGGYDMYAGGYGDNYYDGYNGGSYGYSGYPGYYGY